MSIHKHLETDVATIEFMKDELEIENLEFRIFLNGQDPEKIDKIVHRLNQMVSDQIDYTKCGNCSTKMSPSVLEDGINRIAARLDMRAKEVIEKYVEID